MSCKHCEMDERGNGAIFYDEHFDKADIGRARDGYVLNVESNGNWSSICGVRHCPWCGDELGKAVSGE